jgi:hypothetical protein
MDIRTPLARRGAQAGVAPPATGSYIEGDPVAASKMPKSPSEGFGTNRRSPNHSGGPPRYPPDSPRTLGLRTDRSRHMGFWKGVVSSDFADQWKLAITRAERRPSTWVGALGRGASSDAHGPAEKTELVFQSAES